MWIWNWLRIAAAGTWISWLQSVGGGRATTLPTEGMGQTQAGSSEWHLNWSCDSRAALQEAVPSSCSSLPNGHRAKDALSTPSQAAGRAIPFIKHSGVSTSQGELSLPSSGDRFPLRGRNTWFFFHFFENFPLSPMQTLRSDLQLHWTRQLRGVVDSPSLEVSKRCVDERDMV